MLSENGLLWHLVLSLSLSDVFFGRFCFGRGRYGLYFRYAWQGRLQHEKFFWLADTTERDLVEIDCKDYGYDEADHFGGFSILVC